MGATFLVAFLSVLIPVVEVSGDAAMDWAQLQRDFWNWRMCVSPEFSTSKDIYRYNDIVTPTRISHFTLIKEGVDYYLQQLQAINRTVLDRHGQINYDILQNMLLTYNESYDWVMYAPVNPINFLEGPQIDTDVHTESIPFFTRGDFENFLARLTQYPSQTDGYIDSFRQAIIANHTLNKVSIDKVPGQIDNILRSDPMQFAYFAPFNDILEKVSSISTEDKNSMRKRANHSIGDYMESLRRLKHFIEVDYLPVARTKWGVSSWNNGREFYKACLKWHLSVDITPEEVHAQGIKEVERISRKMEETMQKLNFSGTIREFFSNMKNHSRFRLISSEAILEEYNRMLNERILPELSKYFKNIPDRKVRILQMANDGPGGMYYEGSEDGSRLGTFYVNLFRPEDMPTFDMMALLLHETVPGHHLQSIYSQTASLPTYRKGVNSGFYSYMPVSFPLYTAYAEGWGLYAEYLGEEMGLYGDNYELMGRYSSEIFRACRLVVDTGLHVFNWTRADAVDYLLNYTSFGRGATEIEVDRYITWPGQACGYKIGELRIKEVRSKAKIKLGDKFNIRDFHSVILNSGQVPLSLLERVVDDWIAEVGTTTPSTTKGPDGTGKFPVSSAHNSQQVSSLMLLYLYVIMHATKHFSSL